MLESLSRGAERLTASRKARQAYFQYAHGLKMKTVGRAASAAPLSVFVTLAFAIMQRPETLMAAGEVAGISLGLDSAFRPTAKSDLGTRLRGVLASIGSGRVRVEDQIRTARGPAGTLEASTAVVT